MDLISSYNKYTLHTEPPEQFHFWTLIHGVGSALGRKVFYQQGLLEYYVNLFIILLGPPATKKSTALGLTKKFLQQMPEDFFFLSNIMTKEKLLDEMSSPAHRRSFDAIGRRWEFSQATGFCSEISSFIGENYRADSMGNFLIELWDEKYQIEEKTRKHGTVTAKLPFGNFIGGAVPEWFYNKLSTEIISSGLARRFLLVYAERPARPVPFPDDVDKEITDNIRNHFFRITQMVGRMTLTECAKKVHLKYYDKNYDPAPNLPDYVKSFMGTKAEFSLKLAMIFSAMRDSTRVIDGPILDFSWRLLSYLEGDFDKIYAKMGTNQLNPMASKVTKYLNAERGTSKAVLLKKVWRDMDVQSLDMVLDNLVTMKAVEVTDTMNGDGTTYKLTKESCVREPMNFFDEAKELMKPHSFKSGPVSVGPSFLEFEQQQNQVAQQQNHEAALLLNAPELEQQ